MSEEQHTLGPWRYAPDGGPWEPSQGTYDKVVAADGTVLFYPVMEKVPVKAADWRLMAAAPELLAALKGLMMGISRDGIARADRAIAKAEGREP